MSYQEESSYTFYYFYETEKLIIEEKLKEMGYGWGTNTVCGDCCGMYADNYWVDGIGGNFKKEDKKKMYLFLKKKGISCSIGGYTISANSSDEDEFIIN